jgi:hypothetical protein
MGGMMAATFLAIFFVPMFYKILTERRLKEARTTAEIRAEVEHHRGMEHRTVHNPHYAPRAREGGEG